MAHGSQIMDNSSMQFSFRGIDYAVKRNNGSYQYRRTTYQKSDTVVDQLNNDGFKRFINGDQFSANDEKESRWTSSLNSVIYFAQLPYSLDGDAVYKELLGSTSIDDESYYEIKVTFDEDGGGEDHEDVFIYWVNKGTYLIDYLAYSFCEEECGYRFRESYNRRNLNGMIVQDYHNYKSRNLDPEIQDLAQLFEKNELVKVSDIELERVEVIEN